MWIEQLPSLFRRFYWGSIWRKNSKEKTIYLTFDDGPIPEVTPWVLDILDKYGVKATFFCVGENVMRYPEIYQDVIRRGHQIGNHTYNHLRGFFTTSRKYIANVEKATEYIDSDLFRPPHGGLRKFQYHEVKKKYKVIFWDVISRDYDKDIPEKRVLNIVKKYTRNGSIIVFHDSLKAERNMRYAMPRAVEFLLQEGYQFKTL
ncbi:MAG: polysaccharide deacetylase family protein [Bacteroidales bacterium]|nr:polysaccharide deacetylase family protein [Bacteroidales bacterium]